MTNGHLSNTWPTWKSLRFGFTGHCLSNHEDYEPQEKMRSVDWAPAFVILKAQKCEQRKGCLPDPHQFAFACRDADHLCLCHDAPSAPLIWNDNAALHHVCPFLYPCPYTTPPQIRDMDYLKLKMQAWEAGVLPCGTLNKSGDLVWSNMSVPV